MAFPTSPTLNEIHEEAGRSWKWNGNGWEAMSVPPGMVPVGGAAFLPTVANTYDAADGSRWQQDGYIAPYDSSRHNLTKLPPETKLFGVMSQHTRDSSVFEVPSNGFYMTATGTTYAPYALFHSTNGLDWSEVCAFASMLKGVDVDPYTGYYLFRTAAAIYETADLVTFTIKRINTIKKTWHLANVNETFALSESGLLFKRSGTANWNFVSNTGTFANSIEHLCYFSAASKYLFVNSSKYLCHTTDFTASTISIIDDSVFLLHYNHTNAKVLYYKTSGTGYGLRKVSSSLVTAATGAQPGSPSNDSNFAYEGAIASNSSGNYLMALNDGTGYHYSTNAFESSTFVSTTSKMLSGVYCGDMSAFVFIGTTKAYKVSNSALATVTETALPDSQSASSGQLGTNGTDVIFLNDYYKAYKTSNGTSFTQITNVSSIDSIDPNVNDANFNLIKHITSDSTHSKAILVDSFGNIAYHSAGGTTIAADSASAFTAFLPEGLTRIISSSSCIAVDDTFLYGVTGSNFLGMKPIGCFKAPAKVASNGSLALCCVDGAYGYALESAGTMFAVKYGRTPFYSRLFETIYVSALNKFVVFTNYYKYFVSSDCVTWTEYTYPGTAATVAFSNSSAALKAFTNGTTAFIWYKDIDNTEQYFKTTDLINWTTATPTFPGNLSNSAIHSGAGYSSYLSKYVSFYMNGTNFSYMTSSDGLTWTEETTWAHPNPGYYIWNNENSYYVFSNFGSEHIMSIASPDIGGDGTSININLAAPSTYSYTNGPIYDIDATAIYCRDKVYTKVGTVLSTVSNVTTTARLSNGLSEGNWLIYLGTYYVPLDHAALASFRMPQFFSVTNYDPLARNYLGTTRFNYEILGRPADNYGLLSISESSGKWSVSPLSTITGGMLHGLYLDDANSICVFVVEDIDDVRTIKSTPDLFNTFYTVATVYDTAIMGKLGTKLFCIDTDNQDLYTSSDGITWSKVGRTLEAVGNDALFATDSVILNSNTNNITFITQVTTPDSIKGFIVADGSLSINAPFTMQMRTK